MTSPPSTDQTTRSGNAARVQKAMAVPTKLSTAVLSSRGQRAGRARTCRGTCRPAHRQPRAEDEAAPLVARVIRAITRPAWPAGRVAQRGAPRPRRPRARPGWRWPPHSAEQQHALGRDEPGEARVLVRVGDVEEPVDAPVAHLERDRKSTRLNSSHVA